VKRNTFSKALKHLKSTELDEKIQRLNEAPTNSMSGVYALNDPGFRLNDPDPERIFYADVDGNWPAGIPGTPGELSYTRPKGFWNSGPGTVPAVQTTTTRDYTTLSGAGGLNTDNLIRSSDGFVLANLPPNSRHFILGPLVDGYVLNHGYDDFTNIGYIQKDTRQFVLLASIPGHWSSNLKPVSGSTPRQWNGSSITIYNANFTLAMATWFSEQILSGKFTAAVPYKYSGGVPQTPFPDPNNPGFVSGNLSDDGSAGGAGDSDGNPQNNPQKGNQNDANLYGLNAMDNMGGWLAAAAALGFFFKSIEAFINWYNKQTPEMKQKLEDIRNGRAGGGGNPNDDIASDYDKSGTAGYGNPYRINWGTRKSGGPLPLEPGPGYRDPWDNNDPSTWPSIKNQLKQAGAGSYNQIASYQPQGELISESRQRILREIKQPVKVEELQPQKLKNYKPNFAGRYTAQNTPDVTASPQSDEIVKAKNAAGQTWRTMDKHWSRYESTERMNIVYDNVGHGSQYWDQIVNENQMKKVMRDREVQEHLNIIAHEKAMLREDPLYESPFKKPIQEQETLQADSDPLFKKVRNRLKPVIDYPDKPSKLGYPDEPPPEMVNGFHPQYGERDNYYNALDPHSANAMPSTGNPEIDAKVRRAKTLKRALGKK